MSKDTYLVFSIYGEIFKLLKVLILVYLWITYATDYSAYFDLFIVYFRLLKVDVLVCIKISNISLSTVNISNCLCCVF